MQVDEAQRILGVSPTAGLDAVRAAYRRQMRRTHPDVSRVPDATARTVRLTQAYSILVSTGPGPTRRPPQPRPTAEQRPGAPSRPPPTAATFAAHVVDADTIAVAAPADEVLPVLIDTAHTLGEIVYLDVDAGLIEVIVEFIDAPTSSVLFSLQGRATGVTDVCCTVEPLSGGDAPPTDAVTRLVLHTLVAVAGGPPAPPSTSR